MDAGGRRQAAPWPRGGGPSGGRRAGVRGFMRWGGGGGGGQRHRSGILRGLGCGQECSGRGLGRRPAPRPGRPRPSKGGGRLRAAACFGGAYRGARRRTGGWAGAGAGRRLPMYAVWGSKGREHVPLRTGGFGRRAAAAARRGGGAGARPGRATGRTGVGGGRRRSKRAPASYGWEPGPGQARSQAAGEAAAHRTRETRAPAWGAAGLRGSFMYTHSPRAAPALRAARLRGACERHRGV
ncbi:MAG: hypothetical protein J3K34DRAFT_109438 [Monoraphidium minutum]|nr:MAG: hypothetical protein J3K34DRAFT_109438 [Monoraphidium minutum]